MGMVVINFSKEDSTPSWNVWREAEQPAINGKSLRWVLRCSFCSAVVETAIAIPADGIRICPSCIHKMMDALKTPSGRDAADCDQNGSGNGHQGV